MDLDLTGTALLSNSWATRLGKPLVRLVMGEAKRVFKRSGCLPYERNHVR